MVFVTHPLRVFGRGPVFILKPAVLAGEVNPEALHLAGIPAVFLHILAVFPEFLAEFLMSLSVLDELLADRDQRFAVLGQCLAVLSKLEAMLGGCVGQLPEGVHKLNDRILNNGQSLLGWSLDGS